MVRKFPPFRSERKKRSTSEGTPQFPNGTSGKLPYHLTSNRNFRIFWPNGKHPKSFIRNVLFKSIFSRQMSRRLGNLERDWPTGSKVTHAQSFFSSVHRRVLAVYIKGSLCRCWKVVRHNFAVMLRFKPARGTKAVKGKLIIRR